jgi:hypothetical protein
MPNVQQSIANVIAALPAIGKGDKSPQGYSYRGIEAITKHLQPLLAAHGVVIAPSATITNVVPSPGMKDSWQDIYMTVQWRIYGPDADFIEACTTGIGRDNSDKGANKAQTQAYKYLLLHLLCIADAKDDSDGANYEHGYGERSTPAPPTPGQLLMERCKATKGTPTEAELRAFASGVGQEVSAKAFDADPNYAEQVAALLDACARGGDA